ncbi:galactose-3-O-sulfotransferase 2-like isoform X2 [Saccostrea cucullata]|uniref:galactose-3-O-sulfotransferase 2-like isoform X2 n=1 Tax=Saccostrea cuccullata TaxID=36930 RepID=UPI002ED2B634
MCSNIVVYFALGILFYLCCKMGKLSEFLNLKDQDECWLVSKTRGCLNKKQPSATHVAFLKVHKTGSTVVQGIFLRYGLNRNLTFVVPNNKSWFPNIISINESVIPGYNIISPPKNKTFDILCFHVVYNRSAIQSIMPKDTKYIGIIREPFLQFESTIRYFNFGKNQYGNRHFISNFFRNYNFFKKVENNPAVFSFLNNRMSFEFGFPSHLFDSFDLKDVKQYLEKLKNEFDLVIINEYMDESIILLRRMLNWNVKDVLFVNVNVNRKRHYLDHTKLKNISLYRRYAKLDYELYNFFIKRLWRQIRACGDDIIEEISYFKLLRKSLEKFCKSKGKSFLKVEPTSWSSSFSVTKDYCLVMKWREILYLTRIKEQQY